MWYLIAVVAGFVVGYILSSLLSVSSPKESEKLIYENRILSEKLKVAYKSDFELRQYLSIERTASAAKDGIIADLRKELNAQSVKEEIIKRPHHKSKFIKLNTEV